MNAIKEFFTETIPAFAEAHWAIIMVVLASLTALFLICFLVTAGAKRRQNKRFSTQVMDSVAKRNEKARELEKKEEEFNALNEKYIETVSELKKVEDLSTEKLETLKTEFSEKYDAMERDVKVCKDLLAERECEVGVLTKECQDKDKTIANMVIEKEDLAVQLAKTKDELRDVSESHGEVSKQLEATLGVLHEMTDSVDSLQKELDIVKTEKAIVEKSVVELSELRKQLESDLAEAHKEIEFLKNFELENEILLKTIRTIRTENDAEVAQTKEAVLNLEKRLNSKMEMMFEDMTARVISANLKQLDLSDLDLMKRSQLSKIAKEAGITNFATWSNEKLRAEIRKYKA